jgi:hypothetical protein
MDGNALQDGTVRSPKNGRYQQQQPSAEEGTDSNTVLWGEQEGLLQQQYFSTPGGYVTATAVCGHHGTPTCLDVGRSLGCPFAHSRGEYTVKSAYIQ